MDTATYSSRRGEIEHYFDRTAVAAWARLTSDAPLGRIRRTVRAGREQMRAKLLSWLPADLRGTRILDAGCGTGAFAVEAACRGAEVIGIDLSPTLVSLARDRLPSIPGAGSVDLRAGDMLDPALGEFDHVVAMDSLIHYTPADAVAALSLLAPRVRSSIVFTFAPRTPLLSAMISVGRLFPRGDRAPWIEPMAHAGLQQRIAQATALQGFCDARCERVASGFYTSQALELVRR